MPSFDLTVSPEERRDLLATLGGEGCEVAIAYPFNLARASTPDTLQPALDVAAEIGAAAINLLVFDRDLARRAEATALLCERAAARGLKVGLEFYPPSSVRTLEEAVALCDAAGAANLGLTVDLLHLHRSGGSLEALTAQRHRILLAQICDGPADAPADLFREAALERLLPGEGDLNPAAFLHACGPDVAVSIEAPSLRTRNLPPLERARLARQAARQFVR